MSLDEEHFPKILNDSVTCVPVAQRQCFGTECRMLQNSITRIALQLAQRKGSVCTPQLFSGRLIRNTTLFEVGALTCYGLDLDSYYSTTLLETLSQRYAERTAAGAT